MTRLEKQILSSGVVAIVFAWNALPRVGIAHECCEHPEPVQAILEAVEPPHVDEAIDITKMHWCSGQMFTITERDNVTGKPVIYYAVTDRDYEQLDGPRTIQEGWF